MQVSAYIFWHSRFECLETSSLYRPLVCETFLTVVEKTWMVILRLDHGSKECGERRRP